MSEPEGSPVPFRGIRPFRLADHDIFFVREDETRVLVSLVAVYRGVFLYGDSGNGKSSLINAGLLPRAQALGLHPLRVRVQPRAGEELVVEEMISASGEPDGPVAEVDGAGRVVLSIAEFEQRMRDDSPEHRRLIVFDQFEELVTLFDAPAPSQREIAEMIHRLLTEPLPVKVLLVFREDYLGPIRELLASRPELIDQSLRLGPPPAEALDAIIGGPFEHFPGRFEPEFSPDLKADLSMALAERFGSGAVSLSEVQTVCLRLWQAASPEALLAAKGVQGLLEDELGEALEALAPDGREAAVALISQMVTSGGTRNVISAEDLHERVLRENKEIRPAVLDEALDHLEGTARLVRRERRRDQYLYEITSEFLIPWITRRGDELRVARQRRQDRRRLLIVGSIALASIVLLAIVASIAAWALTQRTEARHQRAVAQRQSAEARRQSSNATALALSASSASALSTRPDISLALAYEAYEERRALEASPAIVRALLAIRQSGFEGVLAAGDGASHVAFSPDGRTLAAASHDGAVRVWGTADRRRRAVLSGPGGPMRSVAFSPDGRMLAGAGGDGRVRLWSTQTLALVRTLGVRVPGGIDDVAFSPNGTLAAAERDGTIRLYDPRRRRSIGLLPGQSKSVFAIAFSPGGARLVSGSGDGNVALWDVKSSRLIRHIPGHRGVVHDVAFSPDGKTIASAGYDSTIQFSSAATGRAVGKRLTSSDQLTAIAFSPDGTTLASSGADRSVRLWSVRTHRRLPALAGHINTVFDVAWSPDGATLASGGADGTVRLWTPAVRRAGVLEGHAGVAFGVAFSPDGRYLASGGQDKSVLVRTRVSKRRIARLRGHRNTVSAVAFSPDGRTLASASFDDSIRLWDPTHAPSLRRLRGHRKGVTSVAFSPDGRLLASGSYDRTVRVWNTSRRVKPVVLRDNANTVYGVAFSPDGGLLASAGADRTVRLWNLRTQAPLRPLRGAMEPYTGVAFSPDGKTLAASSLDGSVWIWDVASRKRRGPLTGATGPMRAVAFSPDGRTLAAASDDRAIRLWDARTLKRLGRLTGHSGAVNSLAFSPAGDVLASASNDGAVRLWPRAIWGIAQFGPTAIRATVCHVLKPPVSRPAWTQAAPGIRYRDSCR